ncbi:MAG TPA: methyltransferase domain-containing protein [Candidatus Pacearchaeota archaeon]|nr:methyltransferase domain-containing protein [Candidatus Pacearchaeota archaeon]HQH20376.1 methyltransferase domain-containing protein [Candidatus Pacearchaeota archaeon]
MQNKSPFQYRVFHSLYKNAALEMCRECEPFIEFNSKILDFGCGSGTVGKQFADYFHSKVLGIDIIDNRVELIDFKQYDGKDLSFLADNSFDVVLINYVLHHTKDPIQSLKDVVAKTKNTIIIYENLPEGNLAKTLCKWHGVSFGVLFQKNFVSGKFFSLKEWEKIFADLNLKLIYAKTMTGFNPMKNTLFVLEKNKNL